MPYPAAWADLAVDDRSADRFVAYGVMIPSEPVPEFDPDIRLAPPLRRALKGSWRGPVVSIPMQPFR